jgi:ABC-type microcin C transport system permease subunit YejE
LKRDRKFWLVGWRLTAWEYFGEIVLAALCTWLVFDIWGAAVISKRLCEMRTDLLLLIGAGLAAAVAIWAIFIGMLAGDFGAWLREKGQASAYSQALAAPIFSYLLGLMVVLFAACSKAHLAVIAVAFLLIYNLVNFVTMVRNVNGLVGLWQAWQQNQVAK